MELFSLSLCSNLLLVLLGALLALLLQRSSSSSSSSSSSILSYLLGGYRGGPPDPLSKALGGPPAGAPHLAKALKRIKSSVKEEDKEECKMDEEAGMEIVRAATAAGLNACYIRDAGRTQVPRGSMTAIAVGPAPCSRIDKVTGHLKLV
ncbi:peptidyl-tRNA hydrolase PTH2 domain-containing protein, putative [Eimeria brunetti]|uniref:peptidyl-tRNA hydrolase n=1 Tax=Eimeria brunetti TaxID=51314 RepID=U6L9F1_9EIME|nr:peptidyl-tRNA hydrolase PTH2 domain-containing protein, putative [Eimeria brunetti]